MVFVWVLVMFFMLRYVALVTPVSILGFYDRFGGNLVLEISQRQISTKTVLSRKETERRYSFAFGSASIQTNLYSCQI